MGPKGKKKATASADDDDWDALLSPEEIALQAAAAKEKADMEAAAAAAAAEAAADADDCDDDGGKDKKKKKKKKAGGKKKGEEDAPKVPTTAAGRMILEQRLAREAEEARIKAFEEEEEARIKAEEEADADAKKEAEDKKEKKRLANEAKIAEQKEAGTYMTKAQKEKAKANEARLEAMRTAGMIVGSGPTKTTEGDAPKSQADLYAKPKRKTPAQLEKERKEKEATEQAEKEATQAAAAAEAAAAAYVDVDGVDSDIADDWDADSDDDDWGANLDSLVDKLADKVEKHDIENCEDTLDQDNKAEQEKLKKLGLERARKEEEQRIKREAEEHLRYEMEQKEIEALMKKENSRKRRLARDETARANRSKDNLRSPISCIMGHVDTGKTKLLDKIRHTNVQEGEAGGITQQIGATQFSKETLVTQTKSMQKSSPLEINLPGLLMIDTPGHESFSNLRSRGSSLCDAAVLVIDLMHGLEPQTIESLNMLIKGKTPFVIALNKVDRLYGWKTFPDSPIRESLAQQDDNTKSEFKDKCAACILQLNEQGLNVSLYWENDDFVESIPIVPTSAHTGEGVPDLLQMIIRLTQELQTDKLMYQEIVQCTVLEVKIIEGLGPTCDVVLVNGTIKEGDTIVISTMDGPLVTTVRALLTPPPNKESRVKSEYIHHTSIHGATGVKVVANDIGKAIAGTPVLVVHPEDDVEDVKEDVHADLANIMKALEVDEQGVIVHASTLGALEALIQFLRHECKPPIPVSHISIGTIYKRDIIRAAMMNDRGHPEFATILAFDVSVDKDAQAMADSDNVRIMTADIIYHLFDQFSAFMRGITEKRREEAESVVQFPVIVKIFQQHVFNKKDPIVVGVEILEGQLRLGTTLCIPSMDKLIIGVVENIQENHRDVTKAIKGKQVAIKIRNEANPTITYGRQFDHNNSLYSKLSRESIDALKEHFKEEMSKDDWQLVIQLKKLFDIK